MSHGLAPAICRSKYGVPTFTFERAVHNGVTEAKVFIETPTCSSCKKVFTVVKPLALCNKPLCKDCLEYQYNLNPIQIGDLRTVR